MIKRYLCICSFLSLISITGFSTNAPVTTVMSDYQATTTPSSTILPVTIQNFNAISSLTLTLNYPTGNITFTGSTQNPAFTGLTVNSSTPGTIVINWTSATGITLPDKTHLIDLTFTYISGTAAMAWNTTGTACQYKKYEGGNLVVLNDVPKTTFYINGVVTNHTAPVTSAPVLVPVSAGMLTIPIRVRNFTNIGSLTLALAYDPFALNYLNTFTQNPAFPFNFLVGNQPGLNGTNLIVIQWFGSSTSLPDSSILVSLNFQFPNASNTAGYSALTWYDNGPSCSFTDGSANPLYDSNPSYFYKDGYVASQVSPVTWLPSISNAVQGTTVPVQVLVNSFTGISALSLAFKYDPAVLTLPAGAYTPNQALGSSLNVTDFAAGADGKRTLVISWAGAPVTMSPGSTIVTLNFTYGSGWTQLKWATGADSCSYSDAQHNRLWKTPADTYFQSGYITSHLSPKTRAVKTTGATGQPAVIPVKVSGFTNIGNFSLTLLYDPGVLGSPTATLVPAIGGTFAASNPVPGEVVMQWSGSATSLPDSSVLLNLSFNYLGGAGVLAWYCTGGSCYYAEGSSLPALFDLPKPGFYTDGSVTRAPVLNAKVFLEGPYSSSAMTTTLLSKGLIPPDQPYSGPPWNYSGNEHVASVPANVTDWVLVELRSQATSSTTVTRRAGFLKNDGSIRAPDGTSLLGFSGITDGNYWVVIRHRNHMGIMSAAPLPLTASGSLYDFTPGSGTVYGGTAGYKLIDAALGKWGMVAADGINDGSVFINDYSDAWVPLFGLINSYASGDFNLDGNIFIDDYTELWTKNFGKSNPLP
jgi:hypothetical protein